MKRLIASLSLALALALSAAAQDPGIIIGTSDRTNPPPPPPPAGESQQSAPADPALFDNEFTVDTGF